MAGLTDEQHKCFEEDGFVVLPSEFSRREVAQMAAEAGRLAQWQVAISLALGEATPRLVLDKGKGRGRNRPVVLRSLRPLLDVSPVFAMYSADDRLLHPLREVMGCEPVLLQEQLEYRLTLPGAPSIAAAAAPAESFDFHVDLAAFLTDGYPRETVSSAITIDDMSADNGAPRVVPGSHKRNPSDARQADAIPLDAPAGSVVVLDAALVHAASPNRSGRTRRALVFSHCPDTADVEDDNRCAALRQAGQEAEDRYADLVYSGADVPEYRLT